MAGPGGHGDGRPGGDVADVEIVLRAEDLGGHQRVGDGLRGGGDGHLAGAEGGEERRVGLEGGRPIHLGRGGS